MPPAESDKLVRTATAPGSSSEPVDVPELGDSLGRYRLECVLGAGGMGVVHAAFDPDLERRVALKVLRTEQGDESRQRLLREARAMARLTHANVVTVHEVGSASGRDYVAMELIDGEPLADWLRGAERTPAEIVVAFLGAGRGLAAAHAAGLVHRDFKPHNVLRGRDGRIVVTDFGLARGVEASAIVDAAQPVSPSSRVTASGSVVGTPAYMAPEQWGSGVVGPAADQFGFCVAMWEALTGERPFRGATIDELKQEVRRGPAALDASKLPRRLRRTLRRGLEPDPAARWPSMTALLEAITSAERAPRVALALAGLVIVTVGVILVTGHSATEGPVCEPPALDPAAVWSSDHVAALAKLGQAPAAAVLDADFQRWNQTRARACEADAGAREPRLACLDGVLARFDAVARATAASHATSSVDAGELLIDPTVCERLRAPRLVPAISPELGDVWTSWLQHGIAVVPLAPAAADALIAHAATEPCAAAMAYLLSAGSRRGSIDHVHDLDEAERAAQHCGDDRMIADVAVATAQYAEGSLDIEVGNKIRHAEALVEGVAQRDLDGEIAVLRSTAARHTDHLDEAITRYEAAVADYAARDRVRAQLRASQKLLELREIRGNPDDLAAVPELLAEWRELAIRRLGSNDEVVRELALAAANWTFTLGDVAAAHRQFDALRRTLPNDNAIRITGTVVDASGAPVAGATVTAGPRLTGDALAAGVPTDWGRKTTARADGTFELGDVADDSIIIAQLGDLRSPATTVIDGVYLALAPTSHVEGRIDLHGEAPTNVTVLVHAQEQPVQIDYTLVAPVNADGTFAIDGVPRGRVMIQTEVKRSSMSVIAGDEIAVTAPIVRGVQLAVGGSKRVVQVIVRSTAGLALSNAQVVVLPGQVASTNALQINRDLKTAVIRMGLQIEGEHAPPQVLARSQHGDLFATVSEVPPGVATACAVGLPPDITDVELQRKVLAHLDRIEVRCVPIGANDDVVTVEVPPWPRLD